MPSDYIIDYSPTLGGWCVYEQVAYADYQVRYGPFPTCGEAEDAFERLFPMYSEAEYERLIDE